MKFSFTKTGFTLLEILVAVSIVAIMTAVGFQGLDSNRNNAADKALMVEFEQVQVALELYKAQNDTKTYPLPSAEPVCGSPVPSGGERFSTDDGACEGSYIQDLTTRFIAELPSEQSSTNPSCSIVYRTDAMGTWYKLTAIDCIAGGGLLTIDSQMARCPSSCVGSVAQCSPSHSEFATSFAIYSQDGQCE